MNVLLVEDDLDDVRLIQYELRKVNGINLAVARSEDEARAALSKPIHLIIADSSVLGWQTNELIETGIPYISISGTGTTAENATPPFFSKDDLPRLREYVSSIHTQEASDVAGYRNMQEITWQLHPSGRLEALVFYIPMSFLTYLSLLWVVLFLEMPPDTIKQGLVAFGALCTVIAALLKYLRDRRQEKRIQELEATQARHLEMIDDLMRENRQQQRDFERFQAERLAFRREVRSELQEVKQQVEKAGE